LPHPKDPAPASSGRLSPESRDTTELYPLLIASVVDYAIFALDPTGLVLSWNAGAQRLKGWTAEEIIGRHFSTFYTPEDKQSGLPAHALAEAARMGRFETEGWRVRKDGTRFWANVVLTALRDADGGLVGYAKVTRDLTARRAAEEQARRLAAESAAREAAERRSEELAILSEQLQLQAAELEAQTEEAQSLTEELESTNEQLRIALDQTEAAEQFSRGILESISDPLVVQDAGWRFRYVNEAARRAFAASFSGGDVLGQVVWDAFPALLGSRFETEMRRAAEQRTPVTFEAFYPERGEWTQMFCYPLPDGGLASQWKNITARKQAEESARYLARASEVLASSLDYEVTLSELARIVVPELADWCAVHVVGDNGIVRQLAVAHVDPSKVEYARQLNERYPPQPEAPTGALHVIRTGRSELYPEIPDAMLAASARDEEHLRLSRELGLRSAMVVPLTARGRSVGALTLVSAESRRRYGDGDLALAEELGRRAGIAVETARLLAEARAARTAAEEANRAKSQFLATMSHELRTPLNAIAGYAELLEIGVHGTLNEEQREAVARVQRSQRHLLALINDILNFARIEAGHLALESSDLPVRDAFAALEPLIAPQLDAKSLRLQIEPVDDQLVVHADAEKVQQILLNLASNAIKFTDAGGRLDVRAAANGDVVRIEVSDTGVGIPADRLEHIFEPFVQLERSLTNPHEGAGLGLAISRDLARAMGGDLMVRSAVGSGSTFTLTLPRAGGGAL
jgi:PAS domain S-box-containing protein